MNKPKKHICAIDIVSDEHASFFCAECLKEQFPPGTIQYQFVKDPTPEEQELIAGFLKKRYWIVDSMWGERKSASKEKGV